MNLILPWMVLLWLTEKHLDFYNQYNKFIKLLVLHDVSWRFANDMLLLSWAKMSLSNYIHECYFFIAHRSQFLCHILNELKKCAMKRRMNLRTPFKTRFFIIVLKYLPKQSSSNYYCLAKHREWFLISFN